MVPPGRRISTDVDVMATWEQQTLTVVNMMDDDVCMAERLTVLEPGIACCSPLTGTPMSADQAEQVAPLLKALADPVRLRLVSLIAASVGGEACVCDLNAAPD